MAKSDYFDLFSDVGNILSNYGRGSAQGRQAEAGEVLTQDDQAIRRYLAGLEAGNLDLNQRRFALGAPSERAGQAVRGDIMQNAQDVSLENLPSYVRKGTVRGGLRPSLMSPETRQFGGDIRRNAILAQLQGDKFAPLPSAPGASQLPGAGAGEKLASGAGLATSLLGAAGKSGLLGKLGGGSGGKAAGALGAGLGKVGGAIGSGLGKVGAGLGSQVGLAAAMPAGLAALGYGLDWWGPGAYDPSVVEPTSYGYKAIGSDDFGPGAASTGAESFIVLPDGTVVPTYGNVNLTDEDVEEAGFGEGQY